MAFSYDDFSLLRTLHDRALAAVETLREKRRDLTIYELRAAKAVSLLREKQQALNASCDEVAGEPVPVVEPPPLEPGPRAIRLTDEPHEIIIDVASGPGGFEGL